MRPLHRIISGTFGQILGPDLKYIRIPDFKHANKAILKHIELLAEQISTDIVETRPRFIDVIRNAKATHASVSYLLDMEITKLLGLDKAFLERLYDELIEIFTNVGKISENRHKIEEIGSSYDE